MSFLLYKNSVNEKKCKSDREITISLSVDNGMRVSLYGEEYKLEVSIIQNVEKKSY